MGTFRISQPGSSVATSLTAGEAKQKNVGLLEIKGTQFRLSGLTLSSVRSFTVGEVNLGEKAREQGGVLDVEDPKVEERMSEVLAAEVDALVSFSFFSSIAEQSSTVVHILHSIPNHLFLNVHLICYTDSKGP